MLQEKINCIEKSATQLGRPFRVLIVDDEKWVRETFEEFCQLSESINVDTVEDGKSALQKITEVDYDLVTVDLIMPELSGLDLLSEMKTIIPGLPVVVITGNATDKLIHDAGMKGANKVLIKPIDLSDFMSEMANILTD